MCKSCWTSQGGQGGKERTCTILDVNAVAEDFFHEKEDLVELKDGTTIKYCQSNKYSTSSFSCGERVEFMVSRYHLSEQDAKIALLEKTENGCSCG